MPHSGALVATDGPLKNGQPRRMIESSWLFSSFGVPWSRAPAGTAKARKLSATNSRPVTCSPVTSNCSIPRRCGDSREVLDDGATGTGVPSTPRPHLARSCGTTETLEPPQPACDLIPTRENAAHWLLEPQTAGIRSGSVNAVRVGNTVARFHLLLGCVLACLRRRAGKDSS